MKKTETNFFSKIPELQPGMEEIENILRHGNVRIERITGSGAVSPDGFWFDQDENEWVMLLQGDAVIEFTDGTKTQMTAGSYISLPAHEKHRLVYTSSDPACIWLAFFWK